LNKDYLLLLAAATQLKQYMCYYKPKNTTERVFFGVWQLGCILSAGMTSLYLPSEVIISKTFAE